MCIGTQMAYRELYVFFLRLINSYRIEADGHVDSDPITGVASVTTTVALPKSYRVRFVPRDPQALKEALEVEKS